MFIQGKGTNQAGSAEKGTYIPLYHWY